MNQDKIGKFIAERRKEKNMTQEQLADMLNIDSDSVMRYENNKRYVSLSILDKMADIFQIPVNFLYDEYTSFIAYPYSEKIKEIRKFDIEVKKEGLSYENSFFSTYFLL